MAVALAACASLLAHALLLPLAGRWFVSKARPGAEPEPMNVTFVDADTLDAPSMENLKELAQLLETPPEPPEPTPRPRQLVETAPTDERRPDEADYLAEQDNRVETESRTEKFRNQPRGGRTQIQRYVAGAGEGRGGGKLKTRGDRRRGARRRARRRTSRARSPAQPPSGALATDDLAGEQADQVRRRGRRRVRPPQMTCWTRPSGTPSP